MEQKPAPVQGRLGTQREYAVHLGCSEPYVSRLKREGKLVMVQTSEGNRVDFEASDATLAAAADASKEGVRERHRRERADRDTPPSAAQHGAGGAAATSRERAFFADAPSPPDAPPRRGAGAPASGGPETLAGGDNPDQVEDNPDQVDEVEVPPADRPNRELYEQRLRAQIRTEQARAAVAELELHARAGLLVRSADAEERMVRHGREVNQAVLQTLVPRIKLAAAPYLSEAQLQELATVVDTEAKTVLRELASRVVTSPGPAEQVSVA